MTSYETSGSPEANPTEPELFRSLMPWTSSVVGEAFTGPSVF